MLSHPFKTAKRNYTILDLPPELLPMVFKNLTLHERKAVKLVCRSWFDVCNLPLFSNDEVLHCLGIYQLSDIYELLSRSERSLLNLKFNHVRTFSGHSPFWKINGSKIRSITFSNCQDVIIMKEIILYCENLVHLAFKYSPSSNLVLLDDLASVSGKGIIRKNLESLEICAPNEYSYITVNCMFQIFSIFTHIKVLKFDLCMWYPIAVYHYLMASKGRIEKLELHYPYVYYSENEFSCYSNIFTDMNSLTELSIKYFFRAQLENLEQFFHSKPLKSLIYYFEFNRDTCVESFFLQLLHSNSALEHLKLNIPYRSIVTKCFLEKLMSCNLKSCHLEFEGGIIVQDPHSFGSRFLAEDKLAALPSLTVTINTNDPSGYDTALFLKCFPNVHHLRISVTSFKILKSLFKYQKKLRSLIADDSYYEPGLMVRRVDLSKYTFNQLTDIEHLELNMSVTYIFLRSLTSEPVLANLKYLKLNMLLFESASDLVKLTDTTPFLEALHISEGQSLPFFNSCEKLCAKLKLLRYISWEGDYGHSCAYENYQRLFTLCPALRILCHCHSEGTNKYFLNTLNREVTRVPLSHFPGTLAQPRIGGFTVDWLCF